VFADVGWKAGLSLTCITLISAAPERGAGTHEDAAGRNVPLAPSSLEQVSIMARRVVPAGRPQLLDGGWEKGLQRRRHRVDNLKVAASGLPERLTRRPAQTSFSFGKAPRASKLRISPSEVIHRRTSLLIKCDPSDLITCERSIFSCLQQAD
jgi:hypothetical protein